MSTTQNDLWNHHTPGDPMPCDGRRLVEVKLKRCVMKNQPNRADKLGWGTFEHADGCEIIAWRCMDNWPPQPG